MARLAISQKTITDITDGYTINLVPNNGTFSTNNNKTCESDTSFTVNINAFQGSASISSDVEVDLTGISVNRIYNGSTSTASSTYYSITATSGTGSIKKFPLTITVHGINTQASGKVACEADALLFNIPVYVEGTPTNNPGTTDDDVVMNITFVATGSQTGASGHDGTSSYTWIRYADSDDPAWADTSTDPEGMSYIGFAKTTTNVEPTGDPDDYAPWTKFVGTDGRDGDDAYTFVIKSSAGDVFRNNNGSTTITLYIYKSDMTHMTAAAFQTETGGTLRWFKDTVPATGTTGQLSSSTDANGNSYITVSASTITNVASYFVILDK
jgi:hypothetical protein